MTTTETTDPEAMDCNELVERVTEYLDAALSPDERVRFERHIDQCPGCLEILEQFRAVVATTGELRADDAQRVDPRRRRELLGRFRTWQPDAR